MQKNKTVLITGGNKSIGLAATERFLNAGNCCRHLIKQKTCRENRG